MKAVSHYTFAFILFVAVFFSLLFMNLISFIMLRKLNKKEEEALPEHYFFAGYELSRL